MTPGEMRRAMRAAGKRFGKKNPHSQCAEMIKVMMAAVGVEVAVSSRRPLTLNTYVAEYAREGVLVCPHKAQFWIEPTSDQIVAWRRDGVQ